MNNTTFDFDGKAHELHSSRLVDSERRLKDRTLFCALCGNVMHQHSRSESHRFIFIGYHCQCGNGTEMIVTKEV